jgi:hypothetical protein
MQKTEQHGTSTDNAPETLVEEHPAAQIEDRSPLCDTTFTSARDYAEAVSTEPTVASVSTTVQHNDGTPTQKEPDAPTEARFPGSERLGQYLTAMLDGETYRKFVGEIAATLKGKKQENGASHLEEDGSAYVIASEVIGEFRDGMNAGTVLKALVGVIPVAIATAGATAEFLGVSGWKYARSCWDSGDMALLPVGVVVGALSGPAFALAGFKILGNLASDAALGTGIYKATGEDASWRGRLP